MISSEVIALTEEIRATLPLDAEWSMMNSLPFPAVDGPEAVGAPSSYLDFLGVADGIICGPVVLFGAADVVTMQFYTVPPDGSNIPLDPEEWYCVGVISDEPWFIKRSDESVWVFPDTGVTWWMSDRFEQASTSLESFFLRVICGDSYLTLAGSQEGDQWWKLLNRLGRIHAAG